MNLSTSIEPGNGRLAFSILETPCPACSTLRSVDMLSNVRWICLSPGICLRLAMLVGRRKTYA